jgi:transcription elongation factor Elf1
MDPEPWRGTLDPDDTGAKPAADVRIQAVACGRCGWPNACRIQSGMRTLRFMCQWCDRMTTGIVDPSIKRNVIF